METACSLPLFPQGDLSACAVVASTQLVATVMTCSSHKLSTRASSALQGGGVLADTPQAKEDGCWLLSRASCCKPKSCIAQRVLVRS